MGFDQPVCRIDDIIPAFPKIVPPGFEQGLAGADQTIPGPDGFGRVIQQRFGRGMGIGHGRIRAGVGRREGVVRKEDDRVRGELIGGGRAIKIIKWRIINRGVHSRGTNWGVIKSRFVVKATIKGVISVNGGH